MLVHLSNKKAIINKKEGGNLVQKSESVILHESVKNQRLKANKRKCILAKSKRIKYVFHSCMIGIPLQDCLAFFSIRRTQSKKGYNCNDSKVLYTFSIKNHI